MTFSVQVRRSAAKELARIPQQEPVRIVEAIDRLAQRPHTGTPLKGTTPQTPTNTRRHLPRVVYEVLIVLVVRVGHRRDAHRN